MPERAAHREWIGGRVLTLLSSYWRDDDPIELTAAIGADWADVLEGIPREYIQRACVSYLRDEPRRKPTPGEIYQRAKAFMPTPKVVHRAETPEEREASRREIENARAINPEKKAKAEEILKQAGFAIGMAAE